MARRTPTAWLVIEKSATRASPEVGGNKVPSILIVVVLPAPLDPSRPKISPELTERVNASTAVKRPKRLVRALISKTTSPMPSVADLSHALKSAWPDRGKSNGGPVRRPVVQSFCRQFPARCGEPRLDVFQTVFAVRPSPLRDQESGWILPREDRKRSRRSSAQAARYILADVNHPREPPGLQTDHRRVRPNVEVVFPRLIRCALFLHRRPSAQR